jgi:hypothetical protein
MMPMCEAWGQQLLKLNLIFPIKHEAFIYDLSQFIGEIIKYCLHSQN